VRNDGKGQTFRELLDSLSYREPLMNEAEKRKFAIWLQTVKIDGLPKRKVENNGKTS